MGWTVLGVVSSGQSVGRDWLTAWWGGLAGFFLGREVHGWPLKSHAVFTSLSSLDHACSSLTPSYMEKQPWGVALRSDDLDWIKLSTGATAVSTARLSEDSEE